MFKYYMIKTTLYLGTMYRYMRIASSGMLGTICILQL